MKPRAWLVGMGALGILAAAACGPAADATLPPTASPPLPTASETPTPPPVSLELPPELAAATEPSVQRFTFPTQGAVPVSAWRPPPYPAPWSLRPGDHFDFSRPIPSSDVNWAHPLYRYGYTFFGEESVHTGVDMGADRNSRVVAAADGEVVWAGYGLYSGTRDLTDPYGLAIAILHDFGYNDQPLYTIYAHLADIEVWMGQRVSAGEEIGLVGDTGHASGPHLHFEVRVGENRYYATRNPELWIVPPEGWGVLAGRILDTAGRPIPEHQVDVRSIDTGRRWELWTYAAQTVNGDDVLGENLALADLPAGAYEITTLYLGRPRTASLWVYPGQTNFFTFQGTRGYVVEPTPAPPDMVNPPVAP